MSLRHVSESIGTATEVLVVRGLLTDDLQFKPVFCNSEFRRPKLAKTAGSDIELLLLDEDGNMLLTERAGIRGAFSARRTLPGLSWWKGQSPCVPAPHG